MNTPYTYLIGWSKFNKWYYGRRTHKNCHPSDLWKTYFTSSKYVKQFRDEFGEPDIIEVRKVFSSIEKCKAWEVKVLSRLNVPKNEMFLNKHRGDTKFDSTGRRWKNSDKFSKRQSNRQMGLVMVKDKNTNQYIGKVPTNHPNLILGIWVGLNFGKSIGKGKPKSKTHRDNISKNTKGKSKTKTDKWLKAQQENKFNYKKKIVCEKCGKSCNSINYNTYHGANCGKKSVVTGTKWCHNPITKERKRCHLPLPDGFILGKGK